MSKVNNYKMFDLSVSGFEFFRWCNNTWDTNSEECTGESEFTVMWEIANEDVSEHPEDLYEDDNGMYEFRDMHREKDAFRRKYGPISGKRFLSAMYQCVNTFKTSSTTRKLKSSRKFIVKMWNLEKMYHIIIKSFPLLKVQMKQMLLSIYEQSVNLNKQIRDEPKTKKMAKYAARVLALMDEVRALIADHFVENIWMIMCLRPQNKMYFVETATPEMLANMGRLEKMYWLPDDVVCVAAPKYYKHWTGVWSPFLARNLPFSEDVCGLIAEYIPRKMTGSTFLDFFRKHFDIKAYKHTTQWRPLTVSQTFTKEEGYQGYSCVSDIMVVLKNVF